MLCPLDWVGGDFIVKSKRVLHAKPKAAGIQQGFFYDFSNYGTYDRLTQDGITQWHPAFLALGATLEICAAAYRKFCFNPKVALALFPQPPTIPPSPP
jgi:hypothetical protein